MCYSDYHDDNGADDYDDDDDDNVFKAELFDYPWEALECPRLTIIVGLQFIEEEVLQIIFDIVQEIYDSKLFAVFVSAVERVNVNYHAQPFHMADRLIHSSSSASYQPSNR